MSTKRVNNWPTKLALFIKEKENQPFDWKENNCGFFTADWLTILTGTDPAKDYRGWTAEDLMALHKERSYGTLIDALAAAHGWPQVEATGAFRGDPVEAIVDGMPRLGVCAGNRSVFAGPLGVVWRDTNSCTRAWRVE